jgi:hypothetical protein
VHEYIFTTIRSDKAVALLVAEPLHFSSRHLLLLHPLQ